MRSLTRLFIILVSLTRSLFREKCLFPIDALVVWCPTWSKNLGRSLLNMILLVLQDWTHLYLLWEIWLIYSWINELSRPFLIKTPSWFRSNVSCSQFFQRNYLTFSSTQIFSFHYALDLEFLIKSLWHFKFSFLFKLFPLLMYESGKVKTVFEKCIWIRIDSLTGWVIKILHTFHINIFSNFLGVYNKNHICNESASSNAIWFFLMLSGLVTLYSVFDKIFSTITWLIPATRPPDKGPIQKTHWSCK